MHLCHRFLSLSLSLCAGVENYCPDGVHLVVGDVPDVAFGAHSPGEAELLVNQHLLTQFVCALKVKSHPLWVSSSCVQCTINP